MIAHEHSHLTFRQRAAGTRTVLRLTLVLTTVFMVVEFVAGLLANSLALLADAGHMFTDVTALALSLMAVRLVALPANPRMTYGYYRLEILAALVNGVLLLVVTVGIVLEAVQRLSHPLPVRGGAMLAVALAGLLVNVAGFLLLRRAHATLNVRSAMLHVLSDAAGSVATIVAALIIVLTGWRAADPLIALVIAGLIVIGGLRIVSEAIQVLMEGTPTHLDLARVEAAMRAVAGVRAVHDLHAWTVTSGLCALSAHVVVADPARAEETLAGLKELLLERFDLVHTTLQIESEAFAEVKGHV
ncbi:MAG: cation transporter [Armatimonadetes bacterium]|nr:cation transporter [Armatimonadota bacterium]